MKYCPLCRQTYADEILYCVSDGNDLVSDIEEVTVVKPPPPVLPPLPPPLPPPARHSIGPAAKYSALGCFIFLLLGAGILVFVMYKATSPLSSKSETPSEAETIANVSTEVKNAASQEQSRLDEQKAELRKEQARIEREKLKLADERGKLDARNAAEAAAPLSPAKPDKPAARINFRPGNMQETISDTVNSERSFMLRAKAGQFLSASVTSNGCVRFGDGSTTTNSSTISGDNYITITNNCRMAASFNLTVNIR